MRRIPSLFRDPRRRIPAVLVTLVLVSALAALTVSLVRGGGGVRWHQAADTTAEATRSRGPARHVPAPPTRDPVQVSPHGRRSAAPPPAAVAPDPMGVRYLFDGGYDDQRGILPLRTTSAGGAIAMVPHDSGRALRFPRPCEHYGAPDCARVVLESGPAPFLNPGTGPIRFGATIQLAAEETTKGANVLQKGYSIGRSQFKLQVDGHAGYPSCVLVGVGSSRIHAAVADRSVADGQWHRVGCVREGASLTVSVDGVPAGAVSLPTTLSVQNDDPLRVGGKGNSANNDQFNGAVDDVYVIPGPQ